MSRVKRLYKDGYHTEHDILDFCLVGIQTVENRLWLTFGHHTIKHVMWEKIKNKNREKQRERARH